MRTTVGQQILQEITTEINDEIDDRKREFLFKEAWNIIIKAWVTLNRTLSFIFKGILILLVLGLVFMNESVLTDILSTPIGEFIKYKNAIMPVVVITLLFVYVVVAQDLGVNLSAKEKYTLDKENFLNQQQKQIELIEEVLYRHNLIPKENNKND